MDTVDKDTHNNSMHPALRDKGVSRVRTQPQRPQSLQHPSFRLTPGVCCSIQHLDKKETSM